jgi:Xylose isomerase-like TIM barrel
MHERLSVHAVCFAGASLGELSGYWRELGAHRVSLVSYFLLEEGLAAAQEALRTSTCTVESVTHPFLLPGRHLEQREESWHDARDTLTRVIQDAKSLGARSIYMRDTVTLAELAGVGVCMDLFACWTEAGLRESIERAMPRCHLVQVCDYVHGDRSLPSRAVPGDGAIPVRRILEWVLQAGYTGSFDIELIGPRIDAEGRVKAVRRAAEILGETLRSLRA